MKVGDINTTLRTFVNIQNTIMENKNEQFALLIAAYLVFKHSSPLWAFHAFIA